MSLLKIPIGSALLEPIGIFCDGVMGLGGDAVLLRLGDGNLVGVAQGDVPTAGGIDEVGVDF